MARKVEFCDLIGCWPEAFDNRQSSLHPNTEPVAVSHHRNAVRKPRSYFHCRYADRLSASLHHSHVHRCIAAQRVSEARLHINTTQSRILGSAHQHVIQLWECRRREEDGYTVWKYNCASWRPLWRFVATTTTAECCGTQLVRHQHGSTSDWRPLRLDSTATTADHWI